MHLLHLRLSARQMHADGVAFSEIHRVLGLSRDTVADWLYRGRDRDATLVERCPRCARPSRTMDDPPAYAYLLGQYLGDCHVLMTQRVPLLTVTCDSRYLGIMHEVITAMEACGTRTVGCQERDGCVSVRSQWTHWPCLIPQHGPAKKHDRIIALTDWQQRIVTTHAGRFVRGLFHSDGSRFVNRVRRNGKDYAYPRYMFVNESQDIMRLCQDALDRPGIEWRMSRRNAHSVARRGAVAELDRHVGPKS